MAPRLDWLARHMRHSNTFASWIHQQFHYEYAGQPLPDWQREFTEGQDNGDLDRRPDLGPWLACVFIIPEARGKGLAERLIEGICAQAKASGEKRIYLHTQDQSTYYAKRGWVVLERFEAWEKDQWLMTRDL